MIFTIIGIGLVLLSVYQFYATYKFFRHVQKKGNQETSSFIGLGIWSSFVSAVFLLILGMAFINGLFSAIWNQ